MNIRETLPTDMPDLELLYLSAFPNEELRPLVRALLAAQSDTLSLAAFEAERLAGHIVFTRCRVRGCDADVALLGPLCVAPALQGRGIGTALVEAGVRRLAGEGVAAIYVLGDPGYYARFGFVPQSTVSPPYPLPEVWADAWQSLQIGDASSPEGPELIVPEPWQRPELWAP